LNLPGLPKRKLLNPLPSVINFGYVPPSETIYLEGGLLDAPSDAKVSARLVADTSGGMFNITQITSYSVQPFDTSEMPAGWKGVPSSVLVPVQTVSGSQSINVSIGQAVGVGVGFSSPDAASGATYTASLIIQGDTWGAPRTLPISGGVESMDGSLYWLQNPGYGLQHNGIPRAGHVNDALVLPATAAPGGVDTGALVLATESGGIWFLYPPDNFGQGSATPNSDLDKPNVTSLCKGPLSPTHIYAGCNDGFGNGSLFESHLGENWDEIFPGTGVVYRIVIWDENPSRVVIACDNGIWWAEIPQPGVNYKWKQVTIQADGTPFPQGPFSGLAIGWAPGSSVPNSVVAAAYGVDFTSRRYGIFYGDWSHPGHQGELVMKRATVPPRENPTDLLSYDQNMYRTSLARGGSTMYAVSSRFDNKIYSVLRSEDAGATWIDTNATYSDGKPLRDIAGDQGDYNNCIAVHPNAQGFVVVGWQAQGVFFSHDSGHSWQMIKPEDGLHEDNHGLYFEDLGQNPNQLPKLYICSDGGVAVTTFFPYATPGQPYYKTPISYFYNDYLTNLQFTQLAVSTNLMAGSLQDNGNVYIRINTQYYSGAPTQPWIQFDGGDGVSVKFVNSYLLSDAWPGGLGTVVWARKPNPDFLTDIDPGFAVKIRHTGFPDDNQTLITPEMGIVTTPNFSRQVQQLDGSIRTELMYAVAAANYDPSGNINQPQPIYGLFDSGDQNDLHWEPLGTINSDAKNDMTKAVASVDGTTILLGTTNGRLFKLQPSQASTNVTAQNMSLPTQVTPNGSIINIVMISGNLAFATYNWDNKGRVLSFDGGSWNVVAGLNLPGEPFTALATNGGGIWSGGELKHILFAATDRQVYMSRNNGRTWVNASNGLPTRPHCRDLRHGAGPDGAFYLYLATYGRSIWQTKVSE
jgi:hypothetical protein